MAKKWAIYKIDYCYSVNRKEIDKKRYFRLWLLTPLLILIAFNGATLA